MSAIVAKLNIKPPRGCSTGSSVLEYWGKAARGHHLPGTMTRIEELQEKIKTLQETAEQTAIRTRQMRESVQKSLDFVKQMVREDAKRYGGELPEAIIEDSSPASMAIRCMFHIVSLSDKGYRPGDSVLDHWQNSQDLWFAHPKFDRDEYNNLLSLYFPSL